jgi:ferrochelatase
MKYRSNSSFTHSQADKVGVLITNLGTPDAAQKTDLKRYLREFLSDPRVIEVPRLIWWIILNLVILNIRPKRSAQAYKKVWTERGSPLLFHTEDQAAALRTQLQTEHGADVVVEHAMRYGSPAMESVIQSMLDQGVRKLLVLPLYPQYCAATTASTFDAVAACLAKERWIPELRFVTHYHDFAPYIEALASSVEKHWEQHGRADKLIFTYHGIPKRYLLNGDPYHCECYKTSRLLAQRLGLDKEEYLVTFQSRFGREEWLQPYTDETLKSLATQGVKSVQMICPGFSADCLETIEEIGIENRGYFMEAGGERYEYIPALNVSEPHIDALTQIINQNIGSWLSQEQNKDKALTAQLAENLGAKI